MTLFKDYKEFFEREFELEYHDIHVVREQINELIATLEASQKRTAQLTESYNSIGKINADQALEIRELKLKVAKHGKE